MAPVSLILAVGQHTGWLVQTARDALVDADVVYADAAVPTPWLDSLVRPEADCIRVEASEASRQDARRGMIARRHGAKVVRLYWGASCLDPVVLRDARVLHDAPVAYALVPGVEPVAQGWSAWLQAHPLFGRRVVVLRMAGQASETADLLRTRGAEPWVVPTIELHPPEDPDALRGALGDLGSYDLVAFTSPNGVERTFEELGSLGLDARAFAGCAVAAIGAGTAKRVARHGIAADVVAKTFRGEALAEAILESPGKPAGKRVLVPRAQEAREVLPEMLRDAGVQVDVVAAYRTLPPSSDKLEPLREALASGGVDAVLLTASSTVTNLCRALGAGYGDLLRGTCLASIGPITSARARELGLEVRVEALEFTIPGVVEALEREFS